MSTVLEFNNVSKYYDVSRNISEILSGKKPKVRAVDDVSFKIQQGESVSLESQVVEKQPWLNLY